MSCTCPETNWMDGKGHDAGCPLARPMSGGERPERKALSATEKASPELLAAWEEFRRREWPDRPEEWSHHWKSVAIQFAAAREQAARLEEAKLWDTKPPMNESLGHEYHVGFDPRCWSCRRERIAALAQPVAELEELKLDSCDHGNCRHLFCDCT